MSLSLAFKAFWRALRNPQVARQWISGDTNTPPQLESSADTAHLRLLAMLQQSGRLIDFLQEDIKSYNDAQVGAAVRQIHEECRKKLDEVVTVRPIFDQAEGGEVEVTSGYDPSTLKVVGDVKKTPFRGKLVHKGWKAHKRSLPKQVGEMDSQVLCPAEVEVK